MKKLFLSLAALAMISGVALADEYDLSTKAITEIEVKSVREANDQVILFNSVTGEFSRVDAISFSS